MPPASTILPLFLFMVLLLAAALCGLTASGHFPGEHRPPAMRSTVGAFILFGSMALAGLSVAMGIALVWRHVPWPVLVIGGGAAVLFAPLALRPFSDAFVNGRAALVTFAAASAASLVLLSYSL